MSYLDKETIPAGVILSDMVERMRANWQPLLIYVAVTFALSLINVLITQMLATDGISALMNLVFVVAGLVAQYLLFQAMLRRAGLHCGDNGLTGIRFFGMAFVTFWGVLFAFGLFYVPGLILGARWIAAPCIMMTSDRGVFASLGTSWDEIKGRTTPFALAALAVTVTTLFGGGIISAGFESLGGPYFAELAAQTVIQLFAVCIIALSVTVFSLINPDGSSVAEVFS